MSLHLFLQELVKQEDGQIIMMTVDTLIRLDYNSGEWKTFRTCRSLDTQANNETSPTTPANTQNTQNSVVI